MSQPLLPQSFLRDRRVASAASEATQNVETQLPVPAAETRRDLFTYCANAFLERVVNGKLSHVTRENCHHLLAVANRHRAAEPEGGSGLEISAADFEQGDFGEDDPIPLEVDALQPQEADQDESENNEEDLNESGGHWEEGAGPVTSEASSLATFAHGWARKARARRGRRGRGDAEDDSVSEQYVGAMTPRAKSKLKKLFEGKDGARLEPGDALALLRKGEEPLLDFELPHPAQVHAYICQLHHSRPQLQE
jgi:hypothetical protein